MLNQYQIMIIIILAIMILYVLNRIGIINITQHLVTIYIAIVLTLILLQNYTPSMIESLFSYLTIPIEETVTSTAEIPVLAEVPVTNPIENTIIEPLQNDIQQLNIKIEELNNTMKDLAVFQQKSLELYSSSTQVTALQQNGTTLEAQLQLVAKLQQENLTIQQETNKLLHTLLEQNKLMHNSNAGKFVNIADKLGELQKSFSKNTQVLNSVISQIQTTNQEILATSKTSVENLKSLDQTLIRTNRGLISVMGKSNQELLNIKAVLKAIQDQTINVYALNKDLLAATTASTELQQAGFEALLKATTNNQEYLTKLQEHYIYMDHKLHQISQENLESAAQLKEEILRSQKELEKSTAIGFLKDKLSNLDVEISKPNTK